METYRFTREEDYYNDYRRSFFGFTWKKSGWDCLRHYEIMSQHCAPYWLGLPYLEDCPPKVLFRFPKELVLAINKLPGIEIEQVDVKNWPEKRLKRAVIDHTVFPEPVYWELLEQIFDHALKNLTTVAVAEYLLSFLE
jgi:hypothetical protein